MGSSPIKLSADAPYGARTAGAEEVRHERRSRSLTLIERVRTKPRYWFPSSSVLRSSWGRIMLTALSASSCLRTSVTTADQYVRESEGDRMQAFIRFAADSTAGEAIESETVEGVPGEVNFDVTDCKHARFFKSLGEPELGFLLVRSMDFDVVDVLGIGLQRTTTIMQGADRCDFRWQLT